MFDVCQIWFIRLKIYFMRKYLGTKIGCWHVWNFWHKFEFICRNYFLHVFCEL